MLFLSQLSVSLPQKLEIAPTPVISFSVQTHTHMSILSFEFQIYPKAPLASKLAVELFPYLHSAENIYLFVNVLIS